jgi:DNA polymerase-1
MKPSGSKYPQVYFLGEAPGETEDDEGVQFVGRSGQLLRDCMGGEWDDILTRWNNCCRCRPPKNRTPTQEEIERCRNSIVKDIERHKPEVVVLVGNIPLQWATGDTGITKWRGKYVPLKVGNHVCWGYAIIHPAFVLRSPEEMGHLAALKMDLKRLGLDLGRGLGDPPNIDLERLGDGINYARDVEGLARLGRQFAYWGKNRTPVAFDIETTGLRPYVLKETLNGLLSVSFSDGKVTWALPLAHRESNWSPDDRERAVALLRSFLFGKAIKIAHNLPFELEWLSQIFGHDPPWPRTGFRDTMAQSYALDGRKGVHSLDFLIYQHFGFRLKAQSNMDRGNLAETPIDKLLKYNALDAKWTAKLYAIQKKELTWEGLLGVAKLHTARAMTLVRAQQMGLVVDFDRVTAYQEKMERGIDRCLAKISNSKEAALYKENTGKELSPTSNPQLTKLFQDILRRREGAREKNKSGYSVDDESLKAMNLPIADAILEMRGNAKIKGTYLDGCAKGGKHVYPDERIHTQFNSMFTWTGRLSSEGPNIQNFPKREDAWVRSIIAAPPGSIMMSVDYGQIEYRVLGIASEDKRICDSLRDRYDVHMDWAKRVAKADNKVWLAFNKDIKKLRSEIKNTMVFPAFYGAHSDYIARMIGMDIRKCRKLFDEFWDEFAGVKAWQERTVKEVARVGYVSCLTGRRRHLPMKKNEILNTPIQGSASDIVLDAMNRLSAMSDQTGDLALQPVMNIHDDLTFYVPEKKQDKYMKIIVDEMLHPSFDWVNVPISVEVSVGKNWGEMKPVGTFFSDDK